MREVFASETESLRCALEVHADDEVSTLDSAELYRAWRSESAARKAHLICESNEDNGLGYSFDGERLVVRDLVNYRRV